MKNRSENSAGRGQILRAFALRRNACLPHLSFLQVNSHSVDQKSGEIWTGQTDLQPISFKSDRLLGIGITLLSDEGVGVHVITQLQTVDNLPTDVTLMDGGTLSFILAGSIEDADNLIVIDAADLQGAPGTVQTFAGEGMDHFLGANRKCSEHEVGLLDLMAVAHLAGHLPTDAH